MGLSTGRYLMLTHTDTHIHTRTHTPTGNVDNSATPPITTTYTEDKSNVLSAWRNATDDKSHIF